MKRPRALVLHGGWEGHDPDGMAAFATELLGDACAVERCGDLDALDARTLAGFDLLVPIWTFGELAGAQERALLEAVRDGLGVVAWHGAASAFLASRAHKHLLGGQFVAHPGGGDVTYRVEFARDAPLAAGLADCVVTTEQYYLLVDPAVEVIATTTILGGDLPWLAGVTMPVAWTRAWGRGRVFYLSLGHAVEVLRAPPFTTLLRRAAAWAARR